MNVVQRPSFPGVALVYGAAMLSLIGGCATFRALTPRAAPTSAKEAYDFAVEDLDDGLYDDALRGFADVKAKYPYTRYAPLADLGVADTHLARGKALEAVDAYRSFLRFNPNHPKGAYAMLKIGEAHYEQIPDDWFFLPPPAEKDQQSTKLAIAAFRDMLARFPDSPQSQEARERLEECRGKLADHELYVANFYLERDRFRAAAGRAEGILTSFPGLKRDEEALWIAGYSRYQLGEMPKAADHLRRLKNEFGQGSWASQAGPLLARIPPAQANPPPAQDPPPDSSAPAPAPSPASP